jgi:hypothetical protein
MNNRKQKDGMDAVSGLIPAAIQGIEGADIVGQFGEAALVRIEGRIVLRGGSMTDRMEALEWLSMFMPDAVASFWE